MPLIEQLRSLVAGWRGKAARLDAERQYLERGRWYSALFADEKSEWNRLADEASNLRSCANEVNRLLESAP